MLTRTCVMVAVKGLANLDPARPCVLCLPRLQPRPHIASMPIRVACKVPRLLVIRAARARHAKKGIRYARGARGYSLRLGARHAHVNPGA